MADLLIGEEDDGQLFTVRVGDSVMVQLSVIAATGYRWQSETEPAGFLRLEGSESSAHSGSAIGGRSILTMHFRAGQAETVGLHAWLWRPWQGESSIIRRFGVALDIRPSDS